MIHAIMMGLAYLFLAGVVTLIVYVAFGYYYEARCRTDRGVILWVPVSEGEPTEPGDYFVTLRHSFGPDYVGTRRFDGREFSLYSGALPEGETITAWARIKAYEED